MNNPKAFPVITGAGGINPGMELRDYFAAKAMQAFLTTPREGNFAESTSSAHMVVECAYHIADMMLRERDKALKT